MIKLKFLITVLIIFCACNGSDSTLALGSGYWLNQEGKGLNEVFSRNTNKKGIPPDILNYSNNIDFILVEQKPTKFDDIIHEDDTVTYKFGRNKIYYWIIDKKSGLRIGPLSKIEFQKARKFLSVPQELEFESFY